MNHRNGYYEQSPFYSSTLYEHQDSKEVLFSNEGFIRRNLERYNASGSAQEIFNFVAFLCWYLFLLICCVIPTICAYRRRGCLRQFRDGDNDSNDGIRNGNDARGSASATMFGSSGNMNDFRSSTDSILVFEGVWNGLSSNSYIGRGHVMESNLFKRIKKERLILLSYNTKMTVLPSDLILSENHTDSDVKKYIENDESESKPSITPPSEESSLSSLNTDEDLNNGFLCIPKHRHGTNILYTNGGPRNVSSTCAICLSDYKEGDTVIWSANTECCHAFHDECIIMWLLSINDNEEYICPCCRQTFLYKKEHSSTTLRASFGPYAYLQGHTRPSLTARSYVQSSREENEIRSISDDPNNSDDEESSNWSSTSSSSDQYQRRQIEILDDEDSVTFAQSTIIPIDQT